MSLEAIETVDSPNQEPTDSGISFSTVSEGNPVLKEPPKIQNGDIGTDEDTENTSQLQDELERTELLLTVDRPLGLSSTSLEVMTSGEQLNLLGDVSPDSSEDNDRVSEVVSSGHGSPNGSSRCSSSMGYLEPRPTRASPTTTQSHPTPQELLTRLPSEARGESCEDTHSIQSDLPMADLIDSPRSVESQADIRPSRSTQSLNVLGEGSSRRKRSIGSLFNRTRLSFGGRADHTSQTMAASSTTGLILHERPGNLPAKSAAEERRHLKLYEQMVSAARKKQIQKAKDEQKKEEEKRKKDKLIEDRREEWAKILPNWNSMHKSRKANELWWYGLPPDIRGKVWQKAIGNDLNISPDLYEINLRRCRERLATAATRDRSDSSASQKSISREQSVENIHLDVLRTFPTLGFFQHGGPYNQALHDVLGAYACYRPDIGYVQGMSFLAAVLLLNMEPAEAFISLANLLNRPSYLAFFKVDHDLMLPYFKTFNILLSVSLPKLSDHFGALNFSPDYYLIEWIFTIYTRTLPLDVACRVWDLFCRDGDFFLFRTALGILKMHQSDLLELNTLEDVGGFLGKLRPDLHSDILFAHIDSINVNAKKFEHVLHQQHSRDNT